MSTTARNTCHQSTPLRSATRAAMTTGTKAFRVPKKTAPEVFASMRSSSGIGASSSRSKERLFFSKVTVTASMLAVPKRIDRAMTPGSSARTSTSVSDLGVTGLPLAILGYLGCLRERGAASWDARNAGNTGRASKHAPGLTEVVRAASDYFHNVSPKHAAYQWSLIRKPLQFKDLWGSGRPVTPLSNQVPFLWLITQPPT